MAKQKVKKFADGGMGMMAPRFPSNFTPPAPGQTYINPNIKPSGVAPTNMGGIRFPSNFTPPAAGQTYINPNIKPAGVTGALPPRLQQAATPTSMAAPTSGLSASRMARGNAGPRSRFKSGGSTSSASKRADGCAIRGKTKGKIC